MTLEELIEKYSQPKYITNETYVSITKIGEIKIQFNPSIEIIIDYGMFYEIIDHISNFNEELYKIKETKNEI